ncbi:MAG TPA: oligosaccharide flippase family protein [Bacteroidia bacterium]|nr:oligosaccharide flippase family protein [Bacteroidia bacterium]
MFFLKTINFFRNDQFFKNALILISGTTVAHLIPFILYPVFTRLFTPADFGLFALFIGIISWVDVVSTGRYELAVVIPEKDEDSINVVAGGISFLLVICTLLYIIVFLFGDFISVHLNSSSIKNWFWLVPPAVFVMGIGKIFNNWLIRKKSFKAFAYNKIFQRIIEGISTLGFYVSKFSNGLIAGDFTGRFSLAVISIFQATREGFAFNRINRKKLLDNIKRYKIYPLYNTVPALLNAGCGLLPVFLISAFYTEEITGYFNLSRQLLAIPIALISANVSQVLLKDISEKRNAQKFIYADMKSLFYKLAVMSVLFIVVLYFFSTFLFGFFFGQDWKISGEYTQILVISYAFSFAISPLSIALVALGKVKILSIWQTAYFILVCCLFFFNEIPVKQFLFIIVVIDIIAYSVYLFLISNAAKNFDKSLISDKR